MKNFDDDTKENNKNKKNPPRPRIPNYPYRILIIDSSGSGKTNA